MLMIGLTIKKKKGGKFLLFDKDEKKMGIP